MLFLDKYGWPIEWEIGHPIRSIIRRILLTRSFITKKKWRAFEEKRKKSDVSGCVDQCEMR